MSKKILYSLLVVFACSLFAQENKLDELDKQSTEFFNAITGLEKTYLEEQIKKRKKTIETNLDDGKDVIINGNVQKVTKISQEELERNIFEKENTKVKLGTDIARSKNIKDITIKSMYTFNDVNYVVLSQENLNQRNNNATTVESTLNIEGRYKKGDLILNHRIVYINTRTKTVTLYKKVDDEYGYFIYLNNEAVTVSDLKKVVKDETKKEKVKLVSVKKEQNVIEQKVDNLSSNNSECIYELKIPMLNVRANRDLDGKILKVLDMNDRVSGEKHGDVLKVDTIYRNSGTVVKADGKNFWVSLTQQRFNANKDNCF